MKTIPTSKGNYTIVDDEDYEWLSKYKWHNSSGYAVSYRGIKNGKQIILLMHRLIMNAPNDKIVDHINGNKLDNRKENLRIATFIQNTWNSNKTNKNTTSKYKGVSYFSNWFHVKINYNLNGYYIGKFSNEIAAANAYNYYAKEFFGEFAKLNDVPFMDENEWKQYKVENTSKYKGVSWNKELSKWQVIIWKDGKSKRLGFFDNEIIAANYYNHKIGNKINECPFVSLDKCEKNKYKRSLSSKYNGVYWYKYRNKWKSEIRFKGKVYFIGYFESEIEAAKSWNEKAIELNIPNLNKKLNRIEEFEND